MEFIYLFLIGLIIDFIIGFVLRQFFNALWRTIQIIFLTSFVTFLVLIVYWFIVFGLSEPDPVDAAEQGLRGIFDVGLAFAGGSFLGGFSGLGVGSIRRHNSVVR